MKKKQKRTFLRLTALLAAVVLIVGTVLIKREAIRNFFWNLKNHQDQSETSVFYPISPETGAVGEMILPSARNGMLKLDYVVPGLNTYSLRAMVYSFRENTVLSDTDFGESDFETGQTDQGYFAARESEGSVTLYAPDGTLRQTFWLPGDYTAAALGMSGDEKTVCFYSPKTAELCLWNLSAKTVTPVIRSVGKMEYCGEKDGRFFFLNNGESWVTVCADDQTAQTDQTEGNIRYLCPFGVAVDRENGLFWNDGFSGDETEIVTERVDEVILSVGKRYVLTQCSLKDSDLLTAYDRQTGQRYLCQNGMRILSACEGEDQKIVVCAQKETDGPSRAYVWNLARQTPLSREEEREIPAESDHSLPEKALSGEKILTGVPVIGQFPDFPTGCESVSAVMAMRYAGADITVSEFVDTVLPKSSRFYFQNGVKYGPDPNEVFIGSPRNKNAYGCMAPVIEKAMAEYFGESVTVNNEAGTPMKNLCSRYLDRGIPCLVWVSIGMRESFETGTWMLESGSRYTWKANEHCMVLIGYSDTEYYFCDPYTASRVAYPKSVCEQRYWDFGMQALALTPAEPQERNIS